jgi:FtsP/CotA-like multicopper oxidase with cupredoxin domain
VVKPLKVIASDGGLLEKPVETDYLRHGVAERWEIIIDFSKDAGKNITWYNNALPSVPMFCQSHLLALFRVILPKNNKIE